MTETRARVSIAFCPRAISVINYRTLYRSEWDRIEVPIFAAIIKRDHEQGMTGVTRTGRLYPPRRPPGTD